MRNPSATRCYLFSIIRVFVISFILLFHFLSPCLTRGFCYIISSILLGVLVNEYY